jgi:type VI secretion system protein ImpK
MTEISTYSENITTKHRNNFPTTGQVQLSNNLVFGDRSYYRSKIFNTKLGINPLVAAASPLFVLANQFTENSAPTETYGLYQQLQHEIKAFENNAQAQHYRSETILIARYLLCALLDEVIIFSPWGKQSDCQTHPLLMFFHKESDGGERFFVVLERLTSDPEVHIDLLEFTYLCLSCGFMGKYRHIEDGKEMLEHIVNRLFECIRWQRGELKKELNIASPEPTRPRVAKLHLPVWLIASFTLALLLTIYSSFSYMLGNNAEQVYQQLNSLTTNA